MNDENTAGERQPLTAEQHVATLDAILAVIGDNAAQSFVRDYISSLLERAVTAERALADHHRTGLCPECRNKPIPCVAGSSPAAEAETCDCWETSVAGPHKPDCAASGVSDTREGDAAPCWCKALGDWTTQGSHHDPLCPMYLAASPVPAVADDPEPSVDQIVQEWLDAPEDDVL